MRLRELLIENLDRTGESKSAVVGWGRGMGHKGHMMLASSVLTQAKDDGADPYFVISKTMGKDDPLSPDEKLGIYNQVFPNNPKVFNTATDEMPDLNRVLKKLATMGYGNVTVVVGADQVNAFQYLVRPDKSGVEPYKQFGLDDLKVIARQETNDPSKEEEGPRATPMRQALLDPNMSDDEKFQVWRDAMNPEIDDEKVKQLMQTALQRMQDFAKPKVRVKKDKMAAENSRNPDLMSPSDYDRYQQNQMDYEKRDFKRREMEHELGHEDEWQRQQDSKPVMVGMYFYNVPAGKEDEAASYGVKQTKSGKWAKTKYNKSGRTWGFQKDLADKAFGQGRYWEPKKESRVGEEAAGVGIVTKQNTTADVGPGTLNKMLKAFKLS
jgi:hypothetical protein